MPGMSWKPLYAGVVLLSLSLAPAWAGNVTVKLQGNYTVTTGTSKIAIPASWMQAGHVYTLTSGPVSGNVSAYGDPYLWGVVYVDGSTTRRVVSQSRHTPDLGERAHLQEDMWNTGENKAEFWVRCEVASCYMKLTVYEREEGTFDRKTFYREGVEPGVIDGQFSVYKDFYHPTEKYGDYGLQVDYESDRYIYLYRQDNFSTAGMNALSLWVRSSGSIDEDDLTIGLTTGDHFMLTTWLPLSDYVTIAASHTWYRVLIPLSDLNPSDSSVRGLAIKSDVSGFVYFDDVELVDEDIPEVSLKLPLPGGEAWYLTVEPGGDADCTNGGNDPFHDVDEAYYSIDFAPRNLSNGNGATVLSNVPILAAGDGKVIEAPSTEHSFNGYYVRIDHDSPYDGSGLTSYYLHLQSSAASLLDDEVSQGDFLGYMGSTGQSTGTHLHFQLKYNGDSTIDADALDGIEVDGRLLTDYQVGCRLNVPPTGFYSSSNF